MVFEIPDLDKKQLNRIERKFLHLVKVKAHTTNSSKMILNSVIEALIREKQMELTYDGGEWERRTYKLPRITGIKVLDRKFPYPSKSEWATLLSS